MVGSASATRPSVLPKPAGLAAPAPRTPPDPAGDARGARSSGPDPAGNDAEAKGAGSSAMATRPLSVDGLDEDAALRPAGFLSREEVLRRRLRRVRRLGRYYRSQYWGLMEAVRVRHRDYYWDFGRSPVKGEERGGEQDVGFAAGVVSVEGSRESGRVGVVGLGVGVVGGNKRRDRDRCASPGCKTKPMALTMYCHVHILADQKQKLYKACTYSSKSAHSGPSTCGKPLLRAQALSYCPVHIQKAQKNVSQALKRAGLLQNSSRPPLKINVIIAECIRQIQAKRREDQKAAGKETVGEEETAL